MRKTSIRWLFLMLCCFFLLGGYFSYDNPGPLETQLEKELKLDAAQFSLFYTVYSMPNMVLPIFGGIFLDKVGLRIGIILFSCILCLGQGVFMIGGFQHDFNTMLAGRVIFGFGGETLSVAQSSIVSAWFKGSELAFALGLN
jgi:MFS family permease